MNANAEGRPPHQERPAPTNTDPQSNRAADTGNLFDPESNPDLESKPTAQRPSARGRVTQRDRVWQLLLAGHELTGLSAARDFGILNMASRASELLKLGRPVQKRQVLVDRPGGGGVAREVLYYVDPADRPASAP